MDLKNLLLEIEKIAKLKGLSRPVICGGVPRDHILKRFNDFNDVDLTTGDKTIHSLAVETVNTFRGPNTSYKKMPDGHARVLIDDLKLDFSSNFIVPGIRLILKKMGIVNPTTMQLEVFSRDFTCNTLLMSMDLKSIYDPTQMGVRDIENKIIRTCLPPEVTLGYDHKRIVRIIYLSSKLQFNVSDDIIEWVKKHPSFIADCRPQYLSKKLQKSLNYDKERTIQLLDRMGVWHYLPPLPDLLPYLSQSPNRI